MGERSLEICRCFLTAFHHPRKGKMALHPHLSGAKPDGDPNPWVWLPSLAKIFYIWLILGAQRVTRGCDLKPKSAPKNIQVRFGQTREWKNGPAPTLVKCKTWQEPEPACLIAIPTFITYKWFLSPFRAWSLIHATLVFADYFVTKCGVLLMSLFVFFTITMSISFTLRETQSRMLRFTGLCFFCQSWPGTAIA
jgi:hypothetical protein